MVFIQNYMFGALPGNNDDEGMKLTFFRIIK